jgi:REP element-mobilizing transposase RayT
MDRFWLLSWTCYGHWLPGDKRGFVGNVREADGRQVVHNVPGTPYDRDMPRLEAWVRNQMKGDRVALMPSDAQAMIVQYQETARIRRWGLQAASVMYNHTHVVLGVPGDPDPESILETLKSWATRALRKLRPLPSNGTFWTAKGSKRKLPDMKAVRDAVIYVVRKQPRPLAVWVDPCWQGALDAWDAAQREKLRD